MDSRSLLPIGTKLQRGKYRVDRYLSSGSFGNTYVITNLQFGEQYAMKEFFMKGVNERGKDYTTICVSNKVNYERYEQQRKKFKKEAHRLEQLSNKHLVKVYDLFDENGTTYYVMDLIHGQTMQDAMEETGRTYTENQAINVVYQVLEALDTLHQKGIWHLDLKPANIMINDQGLVKVIDFGASKQMNANLEYTSTSAAICYTPGFAPTEQVDQNISRIGPWTDLYALGATLYYMLTGSQPPSSSEILDGYAFQFKFPVSENIRQLIIWMMKPNRKERPQSVAEVRHYLDKLQKKAHVKEKEETKKEPVMQNFEDNEGDSDNKIKKIAIALVGVIIGLIILIAIGYNKFYQLEDAEDSEVYSFYSADNDSIAEVEETFVDSVAVDSFEVSPVVLIDSAEALRKEIINDLFDAYYVEDLNTPQNRSVIIMKLDRLIELDPAHRSDYETCQDWLDLKKRNFSKMKDNGRGQYYACINLLKKISNEKTVLEPYPNSNPNDSEQSTTKQPQDKSTAIINARQDVIAILGKALKFPKAKDRESLRVDAINKLNNLTSMDAAHKSDYNWCITELKKPITLKDDTGRGQYHVCILKLKALKDNNSSRGDIRNDVNDRPLPGFGKDKDKSTVII